MHTIVISLSLDPVEEDFAGDDVDEDEKDETRYWMSKVTGSTTASVIFISFVKPSAELPPHLHNKQTNQQMILPR